MANKLIAKIIDNNYQWEEKWVKDVKKGIFLIVTYIGCGLAILFNLVGLIGALKEHYCMTCTYAVLNTLITAGLIGLATKNTDFWYAAVPFIIVCLVSYTFAYDLYRWRRDAFARPIIIQTPAPPPPMMATTTTVFRSPALGQNLQHINTYPPYSQPAYSAHAYQTPDMYIGPNQSTGAHPSSSSSNQSVPYTQQPYSAPPAYQQHDSYQQSSAATGVQQQQHEYEKQKPYNPLY
ncbi:uncharacterized protein LOC128953861 [Oppia nitens]|uniref:uncharacterized protein LOC128953861 n=1 Tax=Oppia nitens TaxID=1686743 RepID=UPI0023DB574D|nr:uncharacterized protein LOC128953861 [Oppia nitens]